MGKKLLENIAKMSISSSTVVLAFSQQGLIPTYWPVGRILLPPCLSLCLGPYTGTANGWRTLVREPCRGLGISKEVPYSILIVLCEGRRD